MTVTALSVTRELVERLSAEHPEFRYEITAHGLVQMDLTPPLNEHASLVVDLTGWLVARYGRGRAATEVGISTSPSDPEPYRQVDVALFRTKAPHGVRYNDPATVALVVEVLSHSTENVDKIDKFHEFAAVGIGHYWIADPQLDTVTMWRLTPTGYAPVAGPVPVDDVLASDPEAWLYLEPA